MSAQDTLSKLLSVDTESDENVQSLIKELTTADNIETKTDISQKQVIVLSHAISFARRYDIKPLDVHVRKVMLRLLVSKDRGGRNDIRDSLSNIFRFNLEKSKNESVKV